MIDFLKEQRLSERFTLNSTKDSILGPEKVKYPVIYDISTGGMQFSTPMGLYAMDIGDIFNFTLIFPNSPKNSIWGEIRYIRNDNQTSHYGIQFLKLSWPIWNRLAEFSKDSIEIAEIQKLPNEELAKIEKLHLEVSLNSVTTRLEIDKLLDGKLENINFGGVSLHLYEDIPIDSVVKIDVLFKKTMLTIAGICVWCSHINEETKTFLVGVSFKHVNQEQFYVLSELVLELNHLNS
jgi:hypothetical protein